VSALSQPLVRDDAWVVAVGQSPRAADLCAPGNAVSATTPGIKVVFSGTLFDTDDLARRLGWPAGKPYDAAALVLAAYQRDPDQWAETLSGQYAIVVDDRSRDRVVAVRDRMGTHPLFYTVTGARVLVSWSIDALLAQPGVSQDLNRVALADHLAFRFADINETYYAAIRRVPPGHLLEVRDGSLQTRRYWDVSSKGFLKVTEAEALDMFDRALDRAVSRCLARGKSGIFLSGGLDSVSVAAVAVDRARRDGLPLPLALSLGFSDPQCDEEFVQRSAAETLGIEQEFLPLETALNGSGLLASAVTLSATLPMPLFNVWTAGYRRLAKVGRDRGCRVIMTGTGGDEWLGITPLLAADLLRAGKFRALAKLFGVAQRSYRMTKAEALYGVLWRYGLRPNIAMWLDRLSRDRFRAHRHGKLVASTPAWIAPDPALRAQMDARADGILRPAQPLNGSFYEQEMRSALDHTLVAMEYEELFEFGRQSGVTMTQPYCDADLVELLYRMPPDVLTRGGRAKGLVRETVARRFPALGFDRQRKVNATSFFENVLRTEGPAAWERVDHGAVLAELGVVNGPQLTDLMGRLFVGERDPESYRIWTVLNLAAWVQSRQGRSRGETHYEG